MGDMAEYTDETAFAAEAKWELRELMYGNRNKPRTQTKEPDYLIHQNLLMDDFSDSERKERMIQQYNFNASAKVSTEILRQ